MIVRFIEGATLADSDAVSVQSRITRRTVRRRLVAVACDVATRANLYDANDPTLRSVKGRRVLARPSLTPYPS